MADSWTIRRHLFALVLAIVLPMLGLLAYSLQANLRSTLHEASTATETVAQIAAADAQRFINDSRQILAGLARRPKVRSLDERNCDSILKDFNDFLPQFANIAMTDITGRIVCTALPVAPGKQATVAEAAWFAQARQANQFITGHPHIGPISGKWVSVLAYPIQDEQGRFNGVIGLPINLAKYQPVASNVSLPPGMTVTLVSRDGITIASSNDAANVVGRPYPESALLAEITTDKKGQIWLADWHGGMVYGYAQVADSDWIAICGIPATTIYADAAVNALRGGAIVLLLAIIGGLLAYYLGRRMVLPIIDITETAEAVARGEFGRRAQRQGPTEIQHVAAQFNHMLDVRLRAEAKYRNLLESASDAIVIVNEQRSIILANTQAELMFGYAHGELIGQLIDALLPDRYQPKHSQLADDFIDNPHTLAMRPERTVFGKRKDGSEFPAEISLSPLRTDEGLIVSSIIRDISERRRYEERLLYMAQYDEITGLPNRNLLRDRLTQAIARADQERQGLGVILLNTDRFKEINDTLGHHIGDQVLQAMATRLQSQLGDSTTIARPGGDEFVVIVDPIIDETQLQVQVERIHELFAPPVCVDGQEIFVSVSIGISVYPNDGQSSEQLLTNADIAMSQSKQEGRNTFCFFTPAMDARAMQRLKLETHLRRALANQELVLHYQPQVDVSSGQIKGVEALVRWNSPELGLVSPLTFIGIAEETGLIDSIGEWILRTACAQNQDWQALGLPPITMAVNLSARQFRQKGLANQVQRALLDSGLAARWLELEITESMLMRQPEEAEQTLLRLSATGLKISLDDFGTGYSSLAYLKRFPVGTLKIDQSFVRDLHHDADDAAIVTAVISLAKSLNMEIVAEGVELAEQLAFLKSLDCHYYQGYFFSKPLPAAALTALLQAQQADALK